MTLNPPVIVGIDGSVEARAALRWAAREAAEHHVRLQIVLASAVPLTYGPGITFAQPDYDVQREAGLRLLESAAAAVKEMSPEIGEVDVTTELVSSPPIPSLLDLSKDACMIVVGSRGLGAFRRGLLGSVSTSVARHAHCPVAVVHASESGDVLPTSGPVVVGVDGSTYSKPAIEIAFDEASRRGVDLVAVHAWSDTSDFVIPETDWPATASSEEAVLAESLAGWQERYPEVSVRRVVVKDRPVRNLLEQSEGAQLVVVGSHGRGGFSGMLLGSTSQALMQSVDCPIIIARQPD